ncbi:MAG: hypothetical protein AAGJ35_06385, partial [Myxococcota bacterium]
LDVPFGDELLSFQQMERLHRRRECFYRALSAMCTLLLNGISIQRRAHVRAREQRRLGLAESCLQRAFGARVLLVESCVWGFDRWYRKAPIVVSYSRRSASITVGSPSVEVAEQTCGAGGLMNVFALLGKGWGGRASIGGSPRGAKMTFKQAEETASAIQAWLEERAS